jgi:predicted ATP-grasp superfamily ATP-dependent carboligase
VPPSASIATLDDAMAFVGRHGYPAVVKSDDTYAGGAVRICCDEHQLRRAVETLLMRAPAKPALGERMRRMLDRALGEFVDEKSLHLSIQGFVCGIPVHRCFVAYRGQVWAGVTAIKVQVFPPVTGPSTVVRLTDIPEIALAVETFAAHVGYSGVGSMDFMLDENGKPHAVEFNPRPAPLFRLGIHAGIDLAAALHDAFSGGTPAAPSPWHRNS